MPTTDFATISRKVELVATEIGNYPIDAYWFIQQGLQATAAQLHGPAPEKKPSGSRHVSGRDLCHGLRSYAEERWGPLARMVLGGWNIRCTEDFGRIVFALIEAGIFQKQPQDSLADFREVFDFRRAFEQYRIELK